MNKIMAIIALILGMGIVRASAGPTNPQRMSLGFPFMVYVNNTGTNQTQASGVYVNQTQFNPAPPPGTTNKLMFRPTP